MWQQRFMAILIGVIMVASMAGYAFMSTPPSGPQETVYPDVMNYQITPEERVGVLRSGKALIEYYYPKGCIECIDKRSLYESFVQSADISGYAVLAVAEANETSDFITGLNGDRFELEEITTREDLMEFFCDIAIRKPTVCILQEI